MSRIFLSPVQLYVQVFKIFQIDRVNNEGQHKEVDYPFSDILKSVSIDDSVDQLTVFCSTFYGSNSQ